MDASTNSTIFEIIAWLSQNAFNLLIQSTALILLGMFAARLLGRYGSAVQSAIFRATLVAVLACPIFAIAIDQLGFDGWTIQLPKTTRTVLVPEPEQTIFEYRADEVLQNNVPIASTRVGSTATPVQTETPSINSSLPDRITEASAIDELNESRTERTGPAFSPMPTAITSSGKLVPRTLPNFVWVAVYLLAGIVWLIGATLFLVSTGLILSKIEFSSSTIAAG